MIFSELYSAYYTAVGRIIKLMIGGCRDEREFRRVVEECAFGESAFSILPALKSGKWQLVRPDLSTVIENPPSVPVSLLEQRWLKAVMTALYVPTFSFLVLNFRLTQTFSHYLLPRTTKFTISTPMAIILRMRGILSVSKPCFPPSGTSKHLFLRYETDMGSCERSAVFPSVWNIPKRTINSVCS